MEFLILLLTLAAPITAADNCSIPPIFVDFHDRCVDNCSTIQYGLFMGFGTPFQNESLWPSLSHNETTIGGAQFCAADSPASCNKQTHGIYFSQTSSDFQSLNDYTSLDASGAITQDLATVEETGRVTLNIFTHYFDPSPPELLQLPNYPLTILSNYSSASSPWFGPAGLLGLGSSSILLTLLHSANLIASRSFGLYVGTAYQRAGGAVNGSLTLGGYDSGRFTGDAVRYDLSPPAPNARDPSPYKVQVASVSLTDTANDNATTILSSAPFDAYLTTSQYEMSLPDDITQSFVEATSAVPADSAAAALAGPNSSPLAMLQGFEGELTIVLSSGINITLSTADGTLRNSSNLTPLTAPSSDPASSADGPGIPMLGTSILAHLYLTTNYDSSPPEFHLSPAAQHGKYVITQPLCPNDIPVAYIQHPISSFKRNGIIGAILGGVIGGIGLAFAVWWGIRKYFQKKEHRRWDERYGQDSLGKRRGYGGDEQGMKVLAPYPGRGEGSAEAATTGGGRRAKLKGILKPSSHRAGSERRRLDKGKSPISAYYTEHSNASSVVGKKSWSSSDNSADEEEEGYDMSQLQGALPPQSLGFQQAQAQPQRQASWPVPYPQGQSSLAGGGYASHMSQAALMRGRSQSPSHSRSRSPSPVFSLDEHIPSSQLRFPQRQPQQQQQQQQQTREPVSRAFPQPRTTNDNPYSSVSLTPNTPLPLLASSHHHHHNNNNESSASLRPYAANHHRSNSEERRRQLGLTVNTYFEGPPTSADRVGKKFKPLKQKEDKIVRKPVSEEHGLLKKMFPAS